MVHCFVGLRYLLLHSASSLEVTALWDLERWMHKMVKCLAAVNGQRGTVIGVLEVQNQQSDLNCLAVAHACHHPNADKDGTELC